MIAFLVGLGVILGMTGAAIWLIGPTPAAHWLAGGATGLVIGIVATRLLHRP